MPSIKAALKPYQVEAGIFDNAGFYIESRESVAQVAAFNEFGTPRNPERPAFRTSFFINREKYLKQLKKIAAKNLKGKKTDKKPFNALGKEAQGDIQTSIARGGWKANAKSTQLQKGGGKQLIDNPLIDSGLLLESVDYRVTKK
jgi:hypothetical protein